MSESMPKNNVPNTYAAFNNYFKKCILKQVNAWEDLHSDTISKKDNSILVVGGSNRFGELTPTARIKSWFGHPLPIDRQDWVIDRDGEEVRYVVEYYYVGEDLIPTDASSVNGIRIDARPALDSVESIIDRVFRMPVARFQGKSTYSPPPFFYQTVPNSQANKEVVDFVEKSNQTNSKCESLLEQLFSCSSHDESKECKSLGFELQRCMASVHCPDIVDAFDQAMRTVREKDTNVTDADHGIDYKTFANICRCNEDTSLKLRILQAYMK